MPVLLIKIFQIPINWEANRLLQVNSHLYSAQRPTVVAVLNRNGQIHELVLGNCEKRGKLPKRSEKANANIPIRRNT